jgi:hypothetical protein
MYRIYEDGYWGDTFIPYTDSNVYVLESIDVDMSNNIHAIGYFNLQNQTSDYFVTAYYLYEQSTNQWETPYIISNNMPYRGCDIVVDSLQLPHAVTDDYISQVPIDFATLHRNQSMLGWEPCDTVSAHKEEFYPQIEINAENNPDFIIAEMITNDNLMLKNYYKINDTYVIELIDSNGSIMFKNLQRHNSELILVYGKMALDSGLNSVLYLTRKSINVGIKDTEKIYVSKIYPNPCSTELNISLSVSSLCVCSITLVDILGKTILSKYNVGLIPGNNNIKVALKRFNNHISSHSGYVVIRINNYVLVQPIIFN